MMGFGADRPGAKYIFRESYQHFSSPKHIAKLHFFSSWRCL